MMSRKLASTLFVTVVVSTCASAQGTKQWTQTRFEEFEKGRPQGVAIRSDGFLEPGPRVHEVLTTPSTYVWTLASDRSGNVYLGTGSPATVLKVSADGKSTKLFESKDISVQSVRVGPDGDVYAATLPSGKVYRLKAGGTAVDDGSAKAIFDPAQTELKSKYVWDMAFDADGRLYIAAGGPAAIYRVNLADSSAKPETFFQSDEQSIRCLAFDKDGSLIAGSDGTGLVYRIGKDGKGFVIYDAPKHEVTAVAVSNGKVYASAVGEKNRNNLPPLPVQGNVAITATITFVQPGSVQAFNGNTLIPDGSEIYELNAEGAPRKLWASKDDIVYALRATPEGLLAATGNRGRIFRIQESGESADIAHLEASQAVGFAEGADGLLVGTSNTGKLYSLSKSVDPEASYTSDVFDTGVFSRWGRAEVDAESNARYELFARSGNVENPQRAWSEWQKVTPNNGPLGVPSARFIQWKAVLHGGGAINAVGVNYLPVNVAPVVDEIVVQPGARVAPGSQQQQQQPQQVNITFPNAPQPPSFPENGGNASLNGLKDKTAVTIRWASHDDNGDELIFAVYFRGDGESNWRLLKDKVTDRYYSFDSALLPDGRYQLKVVATDAPSHNPGDALTDEKISDYFLLDTTAPIISGLQSKIEGGSVHATLEAKDSASPIAHAEYSIDAGPWQYIEPVGKLSDSMVERYDFTAPLKTDAGTPADSSGEHIVTVRVYDRFDNVGTAKTVVHGAH